VLFGLENGDLSATAKQFTANDAQVGNASGRFQDYRQYSFFA
jgi:hypothetical protein